MEKIRVLIVDDHPMMREALCAAIAAEADMEVAGEAVNGKQAVAHALALQPDVTVMDLYLPLMDGVEATAKIRSTQAAARILVITSSTEDEKVSAAFQAGALGYIMKDAARSQFIEGVRQVAKGYRFLPPEVAEKLVRGLQQNHDPVLSTLTAREQQVLDLIGDGLTNPIIAQRLSLSESTVRVHIANIMGKLEIGSRSQLVVYAIHHRH